MMKHKYFSANNLFLVFALIFSACSASYNIKSEPTDAAVFVVDNITKEKRSVGKTPMILPLAQVREMLTRKPSSGEFIEFVLEKENFTDGHYFLPTPTAGTSTVGVTAKLSPADPNDGGANKILQLFFNAQRFAVGGEYERAHIEVDKILTVAPKMARAVAMQGAIYFIEKKYDESLKNYESALQLDPNLDDVIKMISHIRKISNVTTTAAPPAGVTK